MTRNGIHTDAEKEAPCFYPVAHGGIRWKGNHVSIGTELDVSVADAKELILVNATEDVKLPAEAPPVPVFKVPSTKQLRRGQGLVWSYLLSQRI